MHCRTTALDNPKQRKESPWLASSQETVHRKSTNLAYRDKIMQGNSTTDKANDMSANSFFKPPRTYPRTCPPYLEFSCKSSHQGEKP